MSLDTNLRTLALQIPAFAALISTRYFIDHIPEVTSGMVYPIERAFTVSDPFSRTHQGTIGGRARVQLDTFDTDQARCDAAADALKTGLDNYRGALGNYNVTIQIKNRQGGWETDSRLYRRMLEAEILYLNQV